ncbi:type II toxin-antitoxin system VapC family toxin [Rhizobium wuzhouense]|uniref:Ribonuclease VapC n=1 Tax=Rhizobium wuzhouense TaxID=1986026 RepID=A0ABX5NPZ1_9HYPH|nr:type II toxin-antitoxin system VapC family toxin [Rhizobium wuzhouense]PYB72516.1 VapC toxin family PIN domain ribonuclease [Rhizobium wuzhouense]
MIVDTSAMVAIFYGEPEATDFTQRIHGAAITRMSVANYLELSMVIEKQLGPDGMRQVDTFIRRAAIIIEPVTVEQGNLARQAFLDFGKGRHKAGLNFGDCFAYALAKDLDEPLLFKGKDFAATDIRSAA